MKPPCMNRQMDPEQVERFPGIYMREMKDIEQYFNLDTVDWDILVLQIFSAFFNFDT